jgi:O-antigen/teichoic acid export membrane protein
MVLVKAGGLLLLPFYWKALRPEDFGVFAIFQIVTQFLVIVFDWGISGAVQRCYHEWGRDAADFIGASYFIHVFFNLIPLFILYYYSDHISALLFGNDFPIEFFKAGIVNTYFSLLSNVPQSLYRSMEKAKKFTFLSAMQFVLSSALALISLYGFKLGLKGYVYSYLSANIIFSLYYLFDIGRIAKITFKKVYFVTILAYAIPTVPAAVLDGMGGIFDRLFLEKYVSSGTLGLYSIARQIAGAYNLLLVSLKTAWLPTIYKIVSTSNNGKETLEKMTSKYVYVVAIFAAAVAYLAEDVILLIGEPKYYGVAKFVPIIILGYFVQGVGHVTGRGLDLAKKTQYYWIMYFFGVSIGIVSIYYLAPKYGAWGAGAAYFISVLVREIIQFLLSNYFYPRKIEFLKLFAFVPFFTIGYQLTAVINTPYVLVDLILKIIILGSLSAIFGIYIFGPNIYIELKKIFLSRAKL